MNKEKLKLDLSSKDWIRCQSKSHIGRSYMFNKATGETKWCSLDANAVAERSAESSCKSSGKKDSPPKVITKFTRTPAQDRLKRLQCNLSKDVKELKEKSSKKERNKSNQNINTTTRKDYTNKIKIAFTTEKLLIPYKATATTSPAKATVTASSSKIAATATSSRTTATASSSKSTPTVTHLKTTVIATPSKTPAIATPSMTTATATPSKTTATASHSKTTATATSLKTSTTAVNVSDIDETKPLSAETPKLSYYGRRLKQSSDTLSLNKSSVAKQSPEKSRAAKNNPDKPVVEKSSDKQIVEKQNSPKSSRFEQDKRSPSLKRRSIRKSPKRSPKKRRSLTHKSVCFSPGKGTNNSIRNNAADDGSSDDAANTLDTTKSPTLRVSIIDKIKAICKNTFRMSSVPNRITKSAPKVTKNPTTNLGLTNSLASLQTAYKVFRDRSESEHNKNEDAAETTTSPELNDKLMLLPAVRSISTPQPLPPSVPPTKVECDTPNNQFVPAYPRGSANSRLERLRQSLFQQPSSSVKNCITDALSSVTNTTDICAKYNKNNNNSNNNTNGSSNDCEPMDWQSIEDCPRNNSVELVSIDNSKCREADTSHYSSNKTDVATVSEYYDSVNANLLRFSAEQQDRIKWSSEIWFTDHYYFVIDTNVLLQNLTFIDDLIEMKLCDTNGTIVYIPYCVLQELDKLKMRSSSESAKTLTVRAIKYLNKKFEERNKHIHAQSAIDERDHLIDVISADDSILNCCLHVKQHVENVVLLTEDVNLRNKAICNNLLVSTKSYLISKHAEPSTSTSASIWQENARQ